METSEKENSRQGSSMTQSWVCSVLEDSTLEESSPNLQDPLVEKLFQCFLTLIEDYKRNTPLHIRGRASSKPTLASEDFQLLISILERGRDADNLLINQVSYCTSPQSVGFAAPSESAVAATLTTSGDSDIWQRRDSSCGYERMTFREVLTAVGEMYPDRVVLAPALASAHEKLVNGVLKKGFLQVLEKKGTCCSLLCCCCSNKRWNTQWVTLFPGLAMLWPISDKGERLAKRRRKIFFDSANTEIRAGEHRDNRYLFHILTGTQRSNNSGRSEAQPQEHLTFAVFDLLERQNWINAFSAGIDLADQSERCCWQLIDRRRRRQRLFERRQRISASPIAPVASLGTDLEERNKRLIEELQQQTQNARDEQLVRRAATRKMDEERTRREELEELNRTQQRLLQTEKEHRRKLESVEADREAELSELRRHLRDITESIDAGKMNGAAVSKARPSAEDRRDVLKQLRSLEEQQQACKQPLVGDGRYSDDSAAETSKLAQLMENSRRRSTSSPSANVQYRIVTSDTPSSSNRSPQQTTTILTTARHYGPLSHTSESSL